jgi:hypothetical protein
VDALTVTAGIIVYIIYERGYNYTFSIRMTKDFNTIDAVV